jgi:hypothetical protein
VVILTRLSPRDLLKLLPLLGCTAANVCLVEGGSSPPYQQKRCDLLLDPIAMRRMWAQFVDLLELMGDIWIEAFLQPIAS